LLFELSGHGLQVHLRLMQVPIEHLTRLPLWDSQLLPVAKGKNLI
jgi:hypothetical protein